MTSMDSMNGVACSNDSRPCATPEVERKSNLAHNLRLASAGLAWLLIAQPALAAPPDPCSVPDNGTGTITLPPINCDYLSPNDVHIIMDGLPPDTTIEFGPSHSGFICSGSDNGVCPGSPGTCELQHPVSGHDDCFDSTLDLQVTGTGLLAGFNRLVSVPLITRVHTNARTPGNDVQAFDTEMFFLEGELPTTGMFPVSEDPDFGQLQIRAGVVFALPPTLGHTILTRLPNGDFNVDSFFDVEYEIFFEGAVGSVLEGMSGTTQGSLKMQAGVPFDELGKELPGLSTRGPMIFGLLAVIGASLVFIRRRPEPSR